MAMIAFSFTGDTVIRVTGGTAPGILSFASPGAVVGHIDWVGGTVKGNTIHIKELATGATVFYDRLAMSYGGKTIEFPNGRMVRRGFNITTFLSGTCLIFLKDSFKS